MRDAQQSERELVVLNIRLRGRFLPFTGLLLILALLPFLGGSASPAIGQQNVVLAAGTPGAVRSAAAAVESARGRLSATPVGVGYDAALAVGGGQMAFPNLTMAATTSGTTLGITGVPVALPGFTTGPFAGSVVGGAGFIRPVDAPETSGFGARVHPVLGRAMFHTGIDLGAVCGTPIRAAAAGTVVYASTTPSWGNRIIIAHSATLKTAYGHQSRMIAKVGDRVQQGQVIGLVGTTGWSTGCHLHFDVIVGDRYVDPAPYLGLGGAHSDSIPFTTPAPGRTPTSTWTPPVPDGDVPIPPTSTPTTPTTPTPTASSSSPTTSAPGTSTSRPGTTTTTRPPTTRPTTPTGSGTGTSTTRPPGTTTTRPPTTSQPSTTTTAPPTTTGGTTTSAPPTTNTTTVPPSTTTSAPPTTSTTTTAAPGTTTTSGTTPTTSTTTCSVPETDATAAPTDDDPPADGPCDSAGDAGGENTAPTGAATSAVAETAAAALEAATNASAS